VRATPATIRLILEDVHATLPAALAAGATEIRPVEDKFYGDRSGMFEDPWGHRWGVATHIEDMSEEEMMRRGQEANAG
jgi:PhnB protein